MAPRTRVADAKVLFPNDSLSAVTGEGPLSRSEVTERVWQYIQRQGLQDKVNKRMINADEKLKRVFGGRSQVSMWEMTVFIGDALLMDETDIPKEFLGSDGDQSEKADDFAAPSAEGIDTDFRARVAESLSSSVAERQARLRNAPKLPRRIPVSTFAFARNPDVVAEVLWRAAGCCEVCGCEAPFVRADVGTPYLEVHHKQLLSRGGEDTVENAIACCPNCHREQHYG